MATKRTSRAFKDISFTFLPHPVTKDAPVLVNERAISQSIRNLVETIPTERFFNSLLGSDVRSSLFEFVDYGTAGIIRDQIKTTIDNFETRVDNVEVYVGVREDSNEFEVEVHYDIIGEDFPTQQFSFLLEATR